MHGIHAHDLAILLNAYPRRLPVDQASTLALKRRREDLEPAGIWPLWLGAGLLILAVMPAIFSYRQRQRRRGLS